MLVDRRSFLAHALLAPAVELLPDLPIPFPAQAEVAESPLPMREIAAIGQTLLLGAYEAAELPSDEPHRKVLVERCLKKRWFNLPLDGAKMERLGRSLNHFCHQAPQCPILVTANWKRILFIFDTGHRSILVPCARVLGCALAHPGDRRRHFESLTRIIADEPMLARRVG